jgi:hypothetical protein
VEVVEDYEPAEGKSVGGEGSSEGDSDCEEGAFQIVAQD